MDGEVDPRAGLAHQPRGVEGKGARGVGSSPTGLLPRVAPVVPGPPDGDPLGRRGPTPRLRMSRGGWGVWVWVCVWVGVGW